MNEVEQTEVLYTISSGPYSKVYDAKKGELLEFNQTPKLEKPEIGFIAIPMWDIFSTAMPTRGNVFQLSNGTKTQEETDWKDILDSDSNNLIKYLNCLKRVENFRYLKTDWDSFGSVAPNEIAISNAQKASLKIAKYTFFPEAINPSSDEGILFEYIIKGKYYVFEFFNDGIIVFSGSGENDKAKEIKLENIEDEILRIKDAK